MWGEANPSNISISNQPV